MLAILFSGLRQKILISSSVILLALVSIGLFVTPAYAITVGDFNVTLSDGSDPEEGVDYTWSDNDSQGATLTIASENPMIISNIDKSNSTKDHIVINPGDGKTAHITFDGVKIWTESEFSGWPFNNETSVNPFLVSSGALELTLAEGSDNSLETTSTNCSGLQNETNKLVIKGSGTLTASGGPNGAGIGYANITICESAHVNAIGGDTKNGTHGGGAGIGSAASGMNAPAPSNILICDNAVVNATGGQGAAGIGASRFTSVENIFIEDNARVIATGTPGVYGDLVDIGSPNGEASNVVISGGYVELTNGKIGGNGSSDGVLFKGGYAPANSYGEPSLEHPRGTIYGVDIADGYLLTENTDSVTSDEHPYIVSNPTGDFLVTGGIYDTTHSFQDGVLTVKANTDVTISMAPGKDKTSNRIVLDAGSNSVGSVTLNGISIETAANNLVAAEIRGGNWTINLDEGSSNTILCGEGAAGVSVSDGASLTIDSSGDTLGKLQVRAARTSNGIWLNNSGTLIINNGVIEAYGGGGQVGIGGLSNGSLVAINGGLVKAQGGHDNSVNTYDGAGIGGYWDNSGCDVEINGGLVEAYGGGNAAGIGGGFFMGSNGTIKGKSGGSITITGGYIKASSIGASLGGNQVNPLSITGGAFNQGSAGGNGSIYGITPDEGYVVRNNEDSLASEYPYRVYPSENASITFADSFETQVYDASEADATGLVTSAVRGSDDAMDELSYYYRKSGSAGAWSAGLPSDAGTYQIKAILPEKIVDGVVYSLCEVVADDTLEISQASLAVSVQDKVITFGDEAPKSGSYSITAKGWQGSDESKLYEELANAINVSSSYSKGDNAGSYPVSLEWVNGAAPESLSNYSVQFSDAVLVVSKANIVSVSVEDIAKKYDGIQVSSPSVSAVDKHGYVSDGACSYTWYKQDDQGDWTHLESAPNEVGSYKVKVSIAEGTNHLSASGELEFSIGRADAQTISVSKIDATKTYDGNPVSVNVDKAGYDGEVVVAWCKSDDKGGWSAIGEAPSDAGSYRVIVSADETDTQQAPVIENGTQDFVILRADQSVDVLENNAVVSPEATAGGDDGSISGLPSNSEWRVASAASFKPRLSNNDGWTAVSADGSITGLAPSAYEIRLAGDDNHNPSDSVVLTVASFSDTHGGIVFPDGTSDSGDGIAVLPSDGGEVIFSSGEKVILPGNATVDPKVPSAATPSGPIVSPDKEGSLSIELPNVGTITVPSGSKVNEDGSVSVSGGSVTLPNGSVVESSGSITVGVDGSVRVPDGGSVVLPDGDKVSSSDLIEINADGTVTLPNGGSVETSEGQTVQVGSGTTVLADGTINDPSADNSLTPLDSVGSQEENDFLPETNDSLRLVFLVLALCVTVSVVTGFLALRKMRRS